MVSTPGRITMRWFHFTASVVLVAICVGQTIRPAQAAEMSVLVTENIGRAGFNPAPTVFNRAEVMTGFEDYLTAIRLNPNTGQAGAGLKGILLTRPSGDLAYDFTIKTDVLKHAQWATWVISSSMSDTNDSPYRHVFFEDTNAQTQGIAPDGMSSRRIAGDYDWSGSVEGGRLMVPFVSYGTSSRPEPNPNSAAEPVDYTSLAVGVVGFVAAQMYKTSTFWQI